MEKLLNDEDNFEQISDNQHCVVEKQETSSHKNFSEKLKNLPQSSGVYLMKDKLGNIIYVGKAKNLKRRVNQYFDTREKNLKTSLLVEKIEDFDYILTNSEYDALMLENNLIKKYQPHYNILLKDGKNFAYLKFDLNTPFPKLEITRKIDYKKNVKYFGPYLNGISAYSVLKLVKMAYPLRTCNLSFKKPEQRECLKFALGECSAPCTNRISKEKYYKIIEKVINFLNGDIKEIEKILTDKMMNFAKNENFERAIEVKNQISMLKQLLNKPTTQIPKKVNIDVVGVFKMNENICVSVMFVRLGKVMGTENFVILEKFCENITSFLVQYYSLDRTLPTEIVVEDTQEDFKLLENYLLSKTGHKVSVLKVQKGVKKTLLTKACENAKEYLEKSLSVENLAKERTIRACENLKTKLGLKNIPYRIEGYDISNISGTNKVASMVVFVNGEPKKSHYRKFKINSFEGIDDFRSMNEVITRRLSELGGADESFSAVPNLILIDGGKGQLSSASKALRAINKDIEIVSLAKREEEVFKECESEPIILAKNDYSLQLLQRVRDESHRFAITFHRKLRNKSELESVLTKIDGVGEQKARSLFLTFKTIENIKNAQTSELCKVKGINEKLAIKIKDFFDKS